MPEWEYRTLDLSDVPRGASEITLLNEAGEQGWDLVTIARNNIAFMKRPVVSARRVQSPVAPRATRATGNQGAR
jgi:hypothetical protein